jgi:hypothetical protein
VAIRTSEEGIVGLPEDERHPDYFKLLVRNCVAAYGKTFNDKLALDYNQVTGKMRALVLDNEEYRKLTRSIRAKRIIEEAEELDALAALAEGVYDDGEGGSDDQSAFDPRSGGKNRRRKTSADKDELNMRFKVAQERRAFLKLDARAEEIEEADALNIFFVPVTREEFEALSSVEAHEGEEDGAAALSERQDQKSDAEKRMREAAADALGLGGGIEYAMGADGIIEEL